MQNVLKKTSFKLLLVLLIVGSFNSYGQDVVKLKHKYYTSYYSQSRHLPVLVSYTLKHKMFDCHKEVKNKAKLVADPLAPDATNLVGQVDGYGYDMGMVISANNNCCNIEGLQEAYYYSNIVPLTPGFNNGLWSNLDKRERHLVKKYGKIKVYAGTSGRTWLIGKYQNVIVPEFVWKVIYVPATGEYECYRFKNEVPYMEKDTLEKHKVDISTIETLAGIHFSAGEANGSFITND